MTDRRILTTVALVAALGGTLAAASDTPRFSDVTAAAGIEFRTASGALGTEKGWATEVIGTGAAWLDYDGDGHLDLYLVNGAYDVHAPTKGEPNRLYRGDGKGRFVDTTDEAGVGDRNWGYGVAVGDFDNDGDPDLYVTNIGPNVLFRNDGDGTFTDVTSKSGVGDDRWGTSAAFFDLEGDGDLDLYVGNYFVGDADKVPKRASNDADIVSCSFRGVAVYCGPRGQVPQQDVLYRNNGDGTFSDVSESAGVLLKKARYTLGVVTADLDNDGLQDLYVANDSVANSLWINQGNGTFKDVGVSRLAALNADGREQAGMGTDAADFNGDGWLDLVVTNFSHDLNTIYRSTKGRFFIDDSARLGLGVTNMALSWGTGFHDFDLDGDLDLFIANGHVYPEVDLHDFGTTFKQTNHLFLNVDGKFREGSAKAGPGFAVKRSFRGAAFADYDADGDVDVLVTALDESPVLLRNDGPRSGHWLEVRLTGGPSNRDAVGTRVVVTVGDRRLVRERKGGGSYLSSSSPRLHFGVGSATTIDLLEVRWPDGSTETRRNVEVDRSIALRQTQRSGK